MRHHHLRLCWVPGPSSTWAQNHYSPDERRLSRTRPSGNTERLEQ